VDDEETRRIQHKQWTLMLEDWMERCVKTLRHVATTRSGLSEFAHLLLAENVVAYTPFVQQVCQDIFFVGAADKAPKHQDWTHYASDSSTLDSLVSGFSRFLRAATPHPARHRRVLLVLVGGVTFQELAIIRRITQDVSTEVCVLSTDIATPDTLFQHLFPVY
jgi:hypothetical protein